MQLQIEASEDMFQICLWKWPQRTSWEYLNDVVTSHQQNMKIQLLCIAISMIDASKPEHLVVVVSKIFDADVQPFSIAAFSKKMTFRQFSSFIACITIRRLWNLNRRLIPINIINKSLLLFNLIIRSLSSRRRGIFSKKMTIVMNFIQESLVHDYFIRFRLSYLIQPSLDICSSGNFHSFNLHLTHHIHLNRNSSVFFSLLLTLWMLNLSNKLI